MSTTKQEAKQRLSEIKSEEQNLLKIINTPEPNEQGIRSQINGLDDIYRLAKTTSYEVIPFKEPKDDDERYYNASAVAKLIATVYNQGKKVEAKNTSQWKYMPYFKITPDTNEPSGFGFSFIGCTASGASTRTLFSFRLSFLDSNHAVDAGEKFPDVYRVLMTE